MMKGSYCNLIFYEGADMKLRDGDRLLTLQEAESLTGRKVSTWRRDIFEKRVPVVHLGRRSVRLQLSVIEGMIQEGFRPAEPAR